MSYQNYIARRYLFSRQGGPLVLIITAISVLGVAIGVCALVTVISVMDGADEDLFRKMIDVYAHVKIAPGEGQGFSNYQALVEAMETNPEIVAAAPSIQRSAAIFRKVGEETDVQPILILGIDPEKEKHVTGISDTVTTGTATPGFRELVIGVLLAKRLQIKLGDSLRIVSTFNKDASGYHPKMMDVKVVGILDSGYYDFDNNAAFVTLATAQRMFLLDDVAEEVRGRLRDPFAIDKAMKNSVAESVKKSISGPFYITGWDDWNRDFFQALKLEKLALFVILLLVIVVAAFNIIGTQILIVMQKTREIGILMSMGVPRQAIWRIFVTFGLAIGGVGTTVGVLAGLSICYVIGHTGFLKLPAAVYGLSHLPVQVNFSTVAIIVASSMTICGLASVFPARQASKLDPVEALRYE